MILALSIGLVVVVLLYVLVIRPQDLPYTEPHSPTLHLEERKAAIYENIRDANFEFLMGKLSPQDYQQTKADLQHELSAVNREMQTVLAKQPPARDSAESLKSKHSAHPGPSPSIAGTHRSVCGNCGASFPGPMRFCGECGHPMGDARA